MKIKAIITGFMLCCTITASAQPYQSIFSADTCQWNVYEIIPDYGRNIVYTIYSDTTIETQRYYKLYRGELYHPSGTVENINEWGFIREDTIEGKYWFLDQETAYDEVLFMDLSLTQNEKFYLVWDYRNRSGDSITVDTVYYENEKKIIEFSYTIFYTITDNGNLKFVEGIGPNNGFSISENNSPPDYYTLLCKYDNSELIYSTEANETGNCYKDPVDAVDKNIIMTNVSIQPNPSSGVFKIHVNDISIHGFQIYIYDSTGKLLLKKQLKENDTTIKLYQKGVSFLVITDGFKIYTKKIINN